MADINYKKLREYIQRPGFEGRSTPQGYVPSGDKSGVTIGVGFDLGQHNEKDLKAIGFNDKLIETLKPYLGKQGDDARKIASNLIVSGKDYIDVIELPVKAKADRIVEKYNQITGKDAFQNLEQGLQNTIFGVMYNVGVEEETGAPGFWKQATSKDWDSLLLNLTGKGPTGGWMEQQETRTRQRNELLASGAVDVQKILDEDKRGVIEGLTDIQSKKNDKESFFPDNAVMRDVLKKY